MPRVSVIIPVYNVEAYLANGMGGLGLDFQNLRPQLECILMHAFDLVSVEMGKVVSQEDALADSQHVYP